MHALRSLASSLVTFAALSMVSAAAHADSLNLVSNGSFQQLSNPAVASEFGTEPNLTASQKNGQEVTGWTSTGYNFVFTPGSADTTGSNITGPYYVKLWGSNNGGLNTIAASPDGGNFLGMDGVYFPGAISQTINNLVVGSTTTVSFWYAGAQQYGYTGITTEGFQVSLGNQTVSTPMLTDSSHGFTGWQQQTLTFTPTSTSEVLSFLAQGTPNGEPPFSLLDGVSVHTNVTPEPSSLVFLLTGATGIGGLLRRRLSR